MQITYKKLSIQLIEKGWEKKDLANKAPLSPATMAKLGRDLHVRMEVLMRICASLNCGVESIVSLDGGETK